MLNFFMKGLLIILLIFTVKFSYAQDASVGYSIHQTNYSTSQVELKIQFVELNEKEKIKLENKIRTLSNVTSVNWKDIDLFIIKANDTRITNIINGIFMEYGYNLITK